MSIPAPTMMTLIPVLDFANGCSAAADIVTTPAVFSPFTAACFLESMIADGLSPTTTLLKIRCENKTSNGSRWKIDDKRAKDDFDHRSRPIQPHDRDSPSLTRAVEEADKIRLVALDRVWKSPTELPFRALFQNGQWTRNGEEQLAGGPGSRRVSGLSTLQLQTPSFIIPQPSHINASCSKN